MLRRLSIKVRLNLSSTSQRRILATRYATMSQDELFRISKEIVKAITHSYVQTRNHPHGPLLKLARKMKPVFRKMMELMTAARRKAASEMG